MKQIRWNEPRFDDEDIESVVKVLRDNYVNEGPKTKELEEELKKYLNVKHVIMTANGTASLFLAVKADSIIKGVNEFEVIVPDMTMIATATAVGWAGGKVKLVDIEKERFTIDINDVKKNINEKTTAIIPVHILGRSANMSELIKVAEENNLTIIEDAAGALGSKSDLGYLGTIGKVGCFSLQSNKIITCGQGGFVITNDDKYYEIMRRLRDFGRMSNKEPMHEIEGYNLKFSDLAAALVLSQFRKLEIRKTLLLKQLELYKKELSSITEISFPPLKGGEIPIWIDVIAKNREKLIEYLKNNQIFSRECWPAIHRNNPYKHLGNDLDYPNSSFISDNCLWLPNGPHLNEDDINYVCDKIKEFYEE